MEETPAPHPGVVVAPSEEGRPPALKLPSSRKKCERDSGLRVVVSLTTTPSRIHNIRPVIENLLHDQTYRPHKVNLYIPDRGIRDGREYEIPEWLRAFERVHLSTGGTSDVDAGTRQAGAPFTSPSSPLPSPESLPSPSPSNQPGMEAPAEEEEEDDGDEEDGGLFSIVRVGKDRGPATKLLPSLELYPPLETGEPDRFRYLTVDDDVVLEPHAIELLVEGSLAHPGAIVGLMGLYHVHDSTGEGKEKANGAERRATSRTVYVHSEWLHAMGEASRRVGLLGGYRGVIYPREVWAARNGGDTLLRDLEDMTSDGTPYLSDDHLFCWNALRRGYRACVVANPYLRKLYDRDDPLGCLNITFLELANPLSVEGTGCDESHARLREYYLSKGWILPECDIVH
jgi:hypothetical protein